MTSLFLIAVTAGAVARVARFAAADHLFVFVAFRRLMLKVPVLRDMFFYDDDDQLKGCGWCLGVWSAIFIVPLAWQFGEHDWFLLPAAILTAAHLAGFLTAIEPD